MIKIDMNKTNLAFGLVSSLYLSSVQGMEKDNKLHQTQVSTVSTQRTFTQEELKNQEKFESATRINAQRSGLVDYLLASHILGLPNHGVITDDQIQEAWNRATTIDAQGSGLVCSALASHILSLSNRGGINDAQIQKVWHQVTKINAQGSNLVDYLLASRILSLSDRGGINDAQIQEAWNRATTIDAQGSLVCSALALDILSLSDRGGINDAQIQKVWHQVTKINAQGSNLVDYLLASRILSLSDRGGITYAQIQEVWHQVTKINAQGSLVCSALASDILSLSDRGGINDAQIQEVWHQVTKINAQGSLVCSALASDILSLSDRGGINDAQIQEVWHQVTKINAQGSDLVDYRLASDILHLPNYGGITQIERQEAFNRATTILSDGSEFVSYALALEILELPHQGGIPNDQIRDTMMRCLQIEAYGRLPALVNAAQARGIIIPPQVQQYLQANNTGPVTSMAMEIHNYTRGKDKALIEELERMIKGKTSPTIHLSDEDLIKLVQGELKELFKDDPKLQENLDILPWILQTSSRQEFLELMRLFHPFLEQNDMGWEEGYGGEMNFKKRLTLFYTQLFGESADAYKGRNDPKTCIKGLLERFATALRMIHPIAKEYFAGAEADMTFFSAFKYFRENPENFVGPGPFASDADYQRAWADAFYKNIQEYGLKPDDAVYSKDVAYRGQTYGKVIEDASKMLTLPEPSQGKVEEAKAENPKPEKPMEEEKKEDTREPHVTQVQSAQTIQISAENELESFAKRLIAIDGGDLSPGEINKRIRNRGRELGIPETDVNKLLLTKNGKPL